MTESPGERQVAPGDTDEWAWDAAANPLPAAADVVVIGGGIVGCSAAWFLARRGLSVLLCEKGRVAGEQSGRNWGWVRQQGRSPVELPLMMRSRAIWEDLGAALGEDVGFRAGGCLYLAADEAELEAHRAFLPVARAHGLDTRLLAPREIGEVLRGGAARWRGALYTPGDGRAEPNRVAPALARAARRAGARVVTRCAARGIERAAGAVCAVATEHGTIATRAVVCAAGAWTSLFARSLGVTVPQLRVRGTVARTAPAPALLEGAAFSSRVAIRRRLDGGYTVAHGSALEHDIAPSSLRFAPLYLPALRQEAGAIRMRLGRAFLDELATPSRWPLDRPSPFERARMLAPAPSAGILRETGAALRLAFPEIAAVPLAEAWAGTIEVSPDVLPIVSTVAGLPGLVIATGFSGHGFGIGPGAGELVAQLVAGEAPAIDPAAFRLQRFFDGTPIRPGPTV